MASNLNRICFHKCGMRRLGRLLALTINCMPNATPCSSMLFRTRISRRRPFSICWVDSSASEDSSLIEVPERNAAEVDLSMLVASLLLLVRHLLLVAMHLLLVASCYFGCLSKLFRFSLSFFLPLCFVPYSATAMPICFNTGSR